MSIFTLYQLYYGNVSTISLFLSSFPELPHFANFPEGPLTFRKPTHISQRFFKIWKFAKCEWGLYYIRVILLGNWYGPHGELQVPKEQIQYYTH